MPFDIVFVHILLCIVDSHRPITIGVMGDPQTSIVPVNGERPNGEVVIGDMDHDGRVILYIIKGPLLTPHISFVQPPPDPIYTADETSYINYIKPLILAAELDVPHVLSVIDTKEHWFHTVHPERMVPSLKDKDPVTGEDVIVFEGTACLQYLADRFDTQGFWTGKTAFERGNVLAWTAYQTAGIG
ncbi:MAG: hypothetical protein Q9177_000151 [Variospora cf. flavescens]